MSSTNSFSSLLEQKNTFANTTQNSKDNRSVFKSANILIQNNTMVWKNMFLQLSNVSSIIAFSTDEITTIKKQQLPFLTLVKQEPKVFYALIAILASLILSLISPLFFFLFLLLLFIFIIWYRSPTIQHIPHEYVRIIMNSGTTYDFEVNSREFQFKMIDTLYSIVSRTQTSSGDIRIDINNSQVFENGTFVGSQFIAGDNDECYSEITPTL